MSALWTDVTLRPTDLDDVGHVNNVVFAALVAAGRMDFIGQRMAPHAVPGNDFWLVRIELDYVKQLFYPGVARIATSVARVGRTSITLMHEIWGGELAARATSVLVYVDKASAAGMPLSDRLAAALKSP
ncbi:acyl-CoA thioesterase [Microbacteriaceae bacterium K1510]|nr:acyl-CoA thioesterase [Microbacteriaceae bacterium K1510]